MTEQGAVYFTITSKLRWLRYLPCSVFYHRLISDIMDHSCCLVVQQLSKDKQHPIRSEQKNRSLTKMFCGSGGKKKQLFPSHGNGCWLINGVDYHTYHSVSDINAMTNMFKTSLVEKHEINGLNLLWNFGVKLLFLLWKQ